MIRMFGIFDLREDTNEAEFAIAYEAFSQHLQENSLLASWEFMVRKPHDGYDSHPPEQSCLVEMTFLDAEQSQKCWDYLEARKGPVDVLHNKMISQTINEKFALYEVIK